MPVLMELDFEGLTPDQYDAIDSTLDAEGDPPEGLIAHTARFDGNTFRALDVWESAEAFDAFAQSRLGPAIGQVLGDDAPPPPEPRFTELHNAYSV